MRYTDASGEWIHIVIGAVIGGVINWAVHGAQFNMEGLKAFGIGAGAGALGAATGGAAFGLAGGAAAGTGGFAVGAFSGAVGTLYSSTFLSLANNAAFGDPIMSGKDLILGIAFGAITGGMVNGISASINGKTFWTGTTPKIAVQPITLPSPAGLAETKGGAKIEASPDIKSDIKIANPAKPTTTPTTEGNLSNNINIDNGYVDATKIEGFNKISNSKIEIYESLQEKFGDGYKSFSAAKGEYIDIKYGQNLNTASEGSWTKVYEAGFLNGNKVEVHYFYNSTMQQYGNPYIQSGKWSSSVLKIK